MPLPQRDSQALGLGLCAGRGGQLAGPRRLQTVAGNPQTFLRGPGRAGRAGAALLPLPPPSSPGWGLHACPPPLRQSPQEGPGPSDAQWRRGQTRVLQKLRAAGPDPSPIGQHPPVSHGSAPTPPQASSTSSLRWRGGWEEAGSLEGSLLPVAKLLWGTPLRSDPSLRPSVGRPGGGAAARNWCSGLWLAWAGSPSRPCRAAQGRGARLRVGDLQCCGGLATGPGPTRPPSQGPLLVRLGSRVPAGGPEAAPAASCCAARATPESIKRGICSASRLPQSGHYAFLSPPLGATYCLLGTWGPEAEPRSGHRLGPGWLFPCGRPVPGGEGESRRQAGWTLGSVSRGCRHEPPRARRRQTAGVCSLTVRSPLPLPGPRSLWSWGSRMSFPSLRDSGHWVWHPP